MWTIYSGTKHKENKTEREYRKKITHFINSLTPGELVKIGKGKEPIITLFIKREMAPITDDDKKLVNVRITEDEMKNGEKQLFYFKVISKIGYTAFIYEQGLTFLDLFSTYFERRNKDGSFRCCD